MSFHVIYRVTSKKSYALLLTVTTVFFILIFLTIGFVEAIYYLPEQVVYPEKPVTQYYLIISAYSISPFTSLYNTKYVEDKITKLGSILRKVPEVLSIVEIDDQALVLRGVREEDLGIILGNYTIEGEGFTNNCIGCIWVGGDLAEKLGIRTNDTLVIYSPLSRSSHVVIVKGIIRTNSISKHELITNLLTAGIIRGACPECVSITIVFLSNQEALNNAYKVFNITPYKEGLLEKALLVLRTSGKRISLQQYETLSSMYLSRIGLSRNIFYALLITLMIILSLGYSVLAESIILLNKENYRVLYEIGLGIKKLKTYALAYSTGIVILSYFSALIITRFLSGIFKISFLGYVLSPYLDPSLYLVALVIILLIHYTSTWSVRVVDEG